MGLSTDTINNKSKNTTALLLIFLVLIVYLPVLNCGFTWDDEYNVIPAEISTLEGLKKIWLKPGTAYQYYPLTFTLFWIEYQFWEDHPTGYHVISLLLHVLNVVLLWRVLLALNVPCAWVIAAVFGIHPVHAESVAWIAERKNVLSGFFYLASLYIYVDRFLINGSTSPGMTVSAKKSSSGAYWGMLFLFACALFAKITACTLPVILLLLLWWKNDRISLKEIFPLIPFFIIATVLGLITLWLETYNVGAIGDAYNFSFLQRLLLAGRALWFYIYTLIWPENIMFIYPRWDIDEKIWWQYLYPLAALGGVYTLYRFRRKIGKSPVTAVLFYIITLLPVIGFLNVYFFRYSLVADHFQYLASIGIIAVVINGFALLLRRFNRTGFILAAILLVTLGAFTWKQIPKYQNKETLWLDSVNKNPGSYIAQNNLGVVYYKQNQLDDALRHFMKALDAKPDEAETYNNIGLVLEGLGNIKKARIYYQSAIELDPSLIDAYNDLGLSYSKQGKIEKAIQIYESALIPAETKSVYKKKHKIYFNLGNARFLQKDFSKAINSYETALTYQPAHTQAHFNLAMTLLKTGQTEKAFAHLRTVIQLEPGHKLALVFLRSQPKEEAGRVDNGPQSIE